MYSRIRIVDLELNSVCMPAFSRRCVRAANDPRSMSLKDRKLWVIMKPLI